MADGLNPSDVALLGRNGFDWEGIMGLLVVAGIFNGGFFGGNNAYENRFLERDVFNTNTNVLESNMQNQIRTLESKYDNAINTLTLGNQNQREVLENRYQTALGFSNAQAQSDRCCCEIKTALHSEGEATRALISNLDRERTQYELNQANTAIANAVQTQNILNSLGNYFPKMGVNPCAVYGYGYGYGTNLG